MNSSQQSNPERKVPFYLTTTLPYVNANPHMGHALEFVQADITARHHRLAGEQVFFNIGTDEHGLKILRKAEEANKEPQEYVDTYAQQFKKLAGPDWLNLSNDAFIRTTDEDHKKAAQEFWRRCAENGDIYKKEYRVKYCVGCEMEKTESELNESGRCPLHPDQELEVIEEENYFFRFSKYEDDLLKLYEQRDNFVVPESRQKEIKTFVKSGLRDFSISRLKEKLPWGVPVPGDDEHVMYVWFDALVNYISTLGWPDDEEKFENYWPGIQFAGKDNLRQQSAMWQAMLLSAGLPPSQRVVIHGFITSEGQKMSKSLGNVIDPVDLIEEYGTDALRYYVARHIHPFEDSDMTDEKFREAYNANLANGLGNLVQRIMTMMVNYNVEIALEPEEEIYGDEEWDEMKNNLSNFRFDDAIDYIWAEIGHLDAYIAETEPYKKIKTDEEEAKEIVAYLALRLYDIAVVLEPFMPHTSTAIRELIQDGEVPEEPLFPRKE